MGTQCQQSLIAVGERAVALAVGTSHIERASVQVSVCCCPLTLWCLCRMRLSVRQRWCSLTSESACLPQPCHHPKRSRALASFAHASNYHYHRSFSNISAPFPSLATISPLSQTAILSPAPSTPSSASHDHYHQALTLAARAAHLGHPHAVLAILESLHQKPNASRLTHPALHNQLLRAYLHCHTLSHSRRYERMREVWTDMHNSGIRCNQRTYSLLLNACIRKHRALLQEQQPSSADDPDIAASSVPPSTLHTSNAQSPGRSCLQECMELVKGVPLSTSTCNLLIKAALLSADHAYPFTLFQQRFPPLIPNASTLSLLVDTALTAPSTTAHAGVNSAMEWYSRVRQASCIADRPALAGTPAMYAKLMRRCLQNAAGTREVQHVPVLFSHMEEAGVRAEDEHVRCLLLALSRLQLNGAGWGVWHKMESERRVQRTDETDALMLRVMSEEKDHKRAMEVLLSIEQRWAGLQSEPSPNPTVSSTVVSNYRSAISNFSRNGHSTTLLALLSHVFSSRYSSAVLRDRLLDSVVRRWCEAGRGVDELRTRVRQWVAAVDMSEQEMAGWHALAAVLLQRRVSATNTATTVTRRDVDTAQQHKPANGSSESGVGSAIQDVLETDEAEWAEATELDHASAVDTAGSGVLYRDKQPQETRAHELVHAVHISGLPVDNGRYSDRADAVLITASRVD